MADRINQALTDQHNTFHITATLSLSDYLLMVIMLLLSLLGIGFGVALTLGKVR